MKLTFNFWDGFIFACEIEIFFGIICFGGFACYIFGAISRIIERTLQIQWNSYFLVRFLIQIGIFLFFLFMAFGAFEITFNVVAANITLIAIVFSAPLREFIENIYGGFSILIHGRLYIGCPVYMWIEEHIVLIGILKEFGMTNTIIAKMENGLKGEIPNRMFIRKIFAYQKRVRNNVNTQGSNRKGKINRPNNNNKNIYSNRFKHNHYDHGYSINDSGGGHNGDGRAYTI